MIYVITGQTATGKTDLALEYADKHNGELVNCDSRQVYKYLDIITGKDLPENHSFKQENKIKNFSIGYYLFGDKKLWLYDIVDPDKYFSSFDYTICAKDTIENIEKRGKNPIIVGGSYFYLKHLLYGFDIGHVEANEKLRQKLNPKSVKELQDILKKLDLKSLESMNNSDINNPRRLIRKIEILMGQSTPAPKESLLFRHLSEIKIVGIKYKDKNKLTNVIKSRVEKRIKNGAIEETGKLIKMGFKADDPGMKTIGYQQLMKFLKGELKKEEAIRQWTIKEIQYAKRQYTFMKKDKNIEWREI